jgi:CDGSH-type Zn-finger protein
VVIALKPDGPLMIEGPVRIELARCEVLEVTDRAALCRCGGSENKPFCDGAHKRIGFTAEGW